jgi:tetratricopeptide (TPR) repeat protein
MPGSTLGNVANCLSQLGRYDEALAAHRRILRREGAQPKHLLDLGLVLLHQGRYHEARQELRRALAQLPESEVIAAAIETTSWAEREEARLRAAGADASPVEQAELFTRTGRRPAAQAAWLAVGRRDAATPDELRRAAAYLALFGPAFAAVEVLDRLRARAPGAPEVAQLATVLEERAARERRLREVWPDAAR